ncbi:MAG: alginate export family protein [Pseudomonadota bacterium]
MGALCRRLARGASLAAVYGLAFAYGPAVAADEPSAIRLDVHGESRARYESLSGQFRRDFEGDDQAFFLRTLLGAEATAGAFSLGFELQDSRSYLDDAGTPLTNSFVNALDVIQAYVKIKTPGVLGAGSTTDWILGRQTVSIASRRQIERVDFANVIKAYTGLHAITTTPRGDALHLLYVALVDRLPADRESVIENNIVADEEQWNRRFWGVHYRRADALPALLPDVWLEAFVYGVNETDTDETPTPNRRYATPGGRIYRAPARARVDFDIEGSLRYGSRRATSAADDTQDLNVEASQLIARLGYTFDAAWRPRIALQYYWASGDEDPNDDRFDQYERLFGGRRGDLNNTSLHGPLTPANLSAPGVRLDARAKRWDARIHYSAASLASKTDTFVIARLRDPTGAAGSFMGHVIDTRARFWIVPKRLQLELGASAFVFGEFTRDVPGAPEGERTLFGYSQLTAFL